MAAETFTNVSVADIKSALLKKNINIRAVVAELFAMALFVYTGCGTAVYVSASNISAFAGDQTASSTEDGSGGIQSLDPNATLTKGVIALQGAILANGSWTITTAMSFGISIMVLAYAIGHVSGCHLNTAVTISLMASGSCGMFQGLANMLAQIVGSILGAGILYGSTPNASQSALGSNAISPGFSTGEAFLAEMMMTMFLCFVVHMTAVDPKSGAKNLAPLAIGFTVFLGHCVLLPVTGCSINPARSFGPALLSGNWSKFWVFVLAPITGGLVAVPFWWIISQPYVERFNLDDNGKPVSKAVGAADITDSKYTTLDDVKTTV